MAGGIGGRVHLYGVAEEARRSIPAQCMGLLCMPASGAHVHAVKGAGNTGEVCAARNSGLWRAQQVCAAGAQLASFPELPSPHAQAHRVCPQAMQSKPMHWAGMLLRASSATP